MRLLSIGETAAELVAVGTLRRWHRQGLLLPFGRTVGGHRRYQREVVQTALGAETVASGKTVCYARVSSHDQAAQFKKTQAARLERYCADAGITDIEVVTDLGSGLNYRKKGLQRLLGDILRGRVARLVLVAKDRLLRFGSELLFRICEFFHVEVVVLDAVPDVSREQQLTEDLVEILTVFSSRLYGSRSRKNLRALAG
ncbi:IS607 family transposase [Paraburkholderia caribensis]|uniref:IS607 family transposase n=1 Tax=Paraburkholderia caribensis TaxID=75105 RepID=UPI00078C18AE|nr:resolvase [Paraburkholderia caribensis]